MSEQLTNRDVAQLITNWKILFGNKLQSDHWDINTIKIWTLALNDLEITPEEFATAQRKSLTLKWPPTAPADFLELGRVDVMLNYQDCYSAYIDAAHHRWDDEGIRYETAKLVGLGAMREQAESKTYPQFQKHYPVVCKLHSQGLLAKPKQVRQIEIKEPSQGCSDEVADYYIAKIRALLVENKNADK